MVAPAAQAPKYSPYCLAACEDQREADGDMKVSGNCTCGRGHAAHGGSFLALSGHAADCGAFRARKSDVVLAAIVGAAGCHRVGRRRCRRTVRTEIQNEHGDTGAVVHGLAVVSLGYAKKRSWFTVNIFKPLHPPPPRAPPPARESSMVLQTVS